jgi:hypothetical protein
MYGSMLGITGAFDQLPFVFMYVYHVCPSVLDVIYVLWQCKDK